jgi:hypothetical protein
LGIVGPAGVNVRESSEERSSRFPIHPFSKNIR